MKRSISIFLAFALIFSLFLFIVCETQITVSTGIIDKNKLLTFRLKNGSTGVLSAFGHKAYIDTDAAELVNDIFSGVCGFGNIFLPNFCKYAINGSATGYYRIYNKMSDLFPENLHYSEPSNSELF